MDKLALDGVSLIGAIALAFLVGVFVSQYIKDKLKGVPSPLRAALKSTEADALSTLKAGETKILADLTSMFKKSTTTVKAVAATGTAVPVAAVPTAPAAPATPATPVTAIQPAA